MSRVEAGDNNMGVQEGLRAGEGTRLLQLGRDYQASRRGLEWPDKSESRLRVRRVWP